MRRAKAWVAWRRCFGGTIGWLNLASSASAGGVGNAGGGGISDAWLPGKRFQLRQPILERALTCLQLREVVLNLAQDGLRARRVDAARPTTPRSGESLSSRKSRSAASLSAASICARIEASIAGLRGSPLRLRNCVCSLGNLARQMLEVRAQVAVRLLEALLRGRARLRADRAAQLIDVEFERVDFDAPDRIDDTESVADRDPATTASVVPAGISIAIGVRSRWLTRRRAVSGSSSNSTLIEGWRRSASMMPCATSPLS